MFSVRNVPRNIRFLSNLKLNKDYKILGMDFPSSRFIKNEDPKKKLTEYEIICGLDFPSSRFTKNNVKK